ncbi:MAG: pantoate--beta-alanine ligase [Anaerolineales bacterium]|nr:pantoate--beta-alanine ligase [Anaerolineales bacterium]
MKIVVSIKELWTIRKEMNGLVGFVPTMGFLHAGHLSLVKKSKEECKNTIVSIFVNPTQFAPNEDLAAYPRDLERDLALLEEAGVDLVWIPDEKEMYPEGYQTWVEVYQVTKKLEGSMRPTHFRGVTTVVAKLFNGGLPDKAFFGQKDAQQVVVIKQMVRDLNIPVEVVVCPIQREDDGLALSSRNTYLSSQERKAALVLSQSLFMAEKAFKFGERSAFELRNLVESMINVEPLAKLQYVSCAHPETLEELETINEGALISMAVYFGKTRLIDNILLVD